jgi:hypothetical protein
MVEFLSDCTHALAGQTLPNWLIGYVTFVGALPK